MAKRELTQDRLHALLSYDPLAGEFRWRTRPSNRVKIGDVAGCEVLMNGRPSRQIRVDGILYLEHRLAWFYVHGFWCDLIDHRDLNSVNNRLANLREADDSQNQFNTPMHAGNRSGFKGVTFHRPSQMYMARINAYGQSHYLGYFRSPEDAHRAYVAAAERLHGEFARAA